MNKVQHFEIPADDIARAKKFYAQVFDWEFEDYPMRKDYGEPDDYEYEPTPHDDVLEKAKRHYAPRPQLDGAEKIVEPLDR